MTEDGRRSNTVDRHAASFARCLTGVRPGGRAAKWRLLVRTLARRHCREGGHWLRRPRWSRGTRWLPGRLCRPRRRRSHRRRSRWSLTGLRAEVELAGPELGALENLRRCRSWPLWCCVGTADDEPKSEHGQCSGRADERDVASNQGSLPGERSCRPGEPAQPSFDWHPEIVTQGAPTDGRPGHGNLRPSERATGPGRSPRSISMLTTSVARCRRATQVVPLWCTDLGAPPVL
jgi:hypothetical protein